MSLTEPVKIRLKSSKKQHYEQQAMLQDKPLGTYLRERLESDDVMLDALHLVRDELMHLQETLRASGEGDEAMTPSPAELEILLLLRLVAGPEKLRTVQATLERLGMDAVSVGDV